jgi:capsular exopolysaccharide synthesis family protein
LKKIEDLKKDIIAVIGLNYKQVENRLRDFDNELKLLEQEYLLLPTREKELAQITRFSKINEKYYLMFIEKKAEFEIAKAGTIPNFQILAPANLPTVPLIPQKGSVYSTWIIIGVISGIGLIIVRYLLQDTIVTQKELESNSTAPVLGIIPVYSKEKLRIARLVVDKNPKSAISESLRSIRTNIDFFVPEKKKIISVTSTVAGEGKTFFAINLGGVLAMSNQKVIMLDMDMRKPKLHLAFDISNETGMSTLLIGRSELKECISKTSLENLDIISAGPVPPNPSELIMRPQLNDIFEELHKEYDIIIVDSPPVGLVTDGILIMQKADLPIYVVRSEYSKKQYLKNINKLIIRSILVFHIFH